MRGGRTICKMVRKRPDAPVMVWHADGGVSRSTHTTQTRALTHKPTPARVKIAGEPATPHVVQPQRQLPVGGARTCVGNFVFVQGLIPEVRKTSGFARPDERRYRSEMYINIYIYI